MNKLLMRRTGRKVGILGVDLQCWFVMFYMYVCIKLLVHSRRIRAWADVAK